MRNSRVLRNTNLNIKHQHFVKPTLETASVFKNIFKWSSFFGFLGLVGSLAAFEGLNQYVEFYKLDRATLAYEPPSNDIEEWSFENDDWSGGQSGGTEPSLPWKAAHLIRSAWIALEWGVGTASNAASLNPSLEISQSYLLSAINHIENNDNVNNKDLALSALYLRLADIRQRMGTRISLNNALDGYEKVHSFLVSKGAPKTALMKVERSAGDVCKSLGLDKESERWYFKCLNHFSSNKKSTSIGGYMPSWLTRRQQVDTQIDIKLLSPSQFRAYIDTLLSLSRLYSTTTRLTEAATVQRRLIDVLTNSIDTKQGLQNDWTKHSLALSQVHLAEVTFALNKNKLDESLGWLQNAEQLSSNVYKSVDNVNASNAFSKNQAHKLTNASQRTASECAYLMGILHQSHHDKERALGCFERAIKTTLQIDTLTKDDLDDLSKNPINRKYIDAYKNVRK